MKDLCLSNEKSKSREQILAPLLMDVPGPKSLQRPLPIHPLPLHLKATELHVPIPQTPDMMHEPIRLHPFWHQEKEKKKNPNHSSYYTSHPFAIGCPETITRPLVPSELLMENEKTPLWSCAREPTDRVQTAWHHHL